MTYDPSFEERPPAPGHRRRSDATWALVRHDYLAGASAPLLCERYGVGLTALRTRAREEGWRRGDQPDPAPADAADDGFDPDAEPLSLAAMTDLAWRRVSHAVTNGRLREALGWERLHRSLRRMADAEAKAAGRARDEGLRAITRRAAARSAALARVTAPGADEADLAALEALLVEQEACSDLPSPSRGGWQAKPDGWGAVLDTSADDEARASWRTPDGGADAKLGPADAAPSAAPHPSGFACHLPRKGEGRGAAKFSEAHDPNDPHAVSAPPRTANRALRRARRAQQRRHGKGG